MTCYRKWEGPCFKDEKKSKKRNYKNECKAEKREKVLDDWFSKYIRLRGCPDDSHGFGRCVTCGEVQHWKEMDCGHYIHRNKMPTRWHENNCSLQCRSCNRFQGGKEAEHRAYLAGKYGEKLVAELEEYSCTPWKKMLHEDVEAEIARYRTKAKQEAERVGVVLK